MEPIQTINRRLQAPFSGVLATTSRVLAATVLLVASVFAASAYARDYKVEVIIFDNANPSVATESNAYSPPKRMTAGSKHWSIPPTMLTEEVSRLRKSADYMVKHFYAWGVESLPYQDSPNYTIAEQNTQGYIKVYADQLLFVNIDLDHNGFRMKEKRRLKLNERHFFDHPKFGLLMQVSRLEKAEIQNDELERSQ